MSNELLIARGLVVAYGPPPRLFKRKSAVVPVLKGVDLRLRRGETLGIVGESGSGKTTLGRTLIGLVRPMVGSVTFDGIEITALSARALRPLRRRMQMIFQDPIAALNPRRTIGKILVDPILVHGLAPTHAMALDRVEEVLDRVGLPRAAVHRYPHELSGGQRQRVGIARAVVLRPEFVLADEIVSGLDVSTQAQVLRLLMELTREMHLAVAIISHDLAVIRSICDRVMVMHDGNIVEEGACDQVFAAPQAAYTRMLIDAIPLPVLDPGWLSRGAGTDGGVDSNLPPAC